MPSKKTASSLKRGVRERPALIHWAVKSRIALMLLALLPIGLLGVYSLYITSTFVHHMVQENNQTAAQVASQLIERELSSSLRLAETFAALPSMRQAATAGDASAAQRVLKVLVESRPGIDRAFVTDPAGVLWSDYPEAPAAHGQSFAHRNWYQEIQRRPMPYVSQVYRRALPPQPLVVAVATPIRQDDQVIGILVYEHRLDAMKRWLQEIRLDEQGYVFLVDQAGNVAAHPTLDLTGQEYEAYAGLDLLERALQGQLQVARYRDPLNDQEMVASFAPIQMATGQYWVVVAQQPTTEAYAPIRRLQMLLAIAAGILTLVALATLMVMGRIQRWLQRSNEQLEHEITERQQIEQRLRHAQAFLDSIIENIPHMIFIKDAKELRFVRFNKAGEELLGYKREELIGKNDYDFFPAEEVEFFMTKDRQVFENNRLEDIPEESIHTRHQGVRILHTKKVPLRDEQGKPTFLLGISEDITERKKAERQLQQLTAALERSNKDLEQFAYIASHDLQEPLRKVEGFGELLQDHLGDGLDAEGRDFLMRMCSATQRMRDLIDGLLTYSRVTTKHDSFGPVDLNEVAREVVSDLELQIQDADGQVQVEDLPTITGDALQMRQLLQNLISNGLKFHPPDRPPRITLRAELTESDPADSKPAAAQGACRLFVQDNGIGIDPQYANQLFVPFRRLHGRGSPYKGTGIGLAVCRKIVERHGGTITIESTPGQGSTFIVTLPCQPNQPREGE